MIVFSNIKRLYCLLKFLTKFFLAKKKRVVLGWQPNLQQIKTDMKRTLTLLLTAASLNLSAHCQMPCGIYHDDMVFDQIDQFVEKMVKCMWVLNNSKFQTPRERAEFIRWVGLKEKTSDEIAQEITTYFLQQKIKPGEEETAERLAKAHQLLFLLVAIKQNTDVAVVDQFAENWEQFKLMFHVEGYECKIEQLKEKKRKASELYKELRKDKESENH